MRNPPGRFRKDPVHQERAECGRGEADGPGAVDTEKRKVLLAGIDSSVRMPPDDLFRQIPEKTGFCWGRKSPGSWAQAGKPLVKGATLR
jgi:hypothetical protein